MDGSSLKWLKKDFFKYVENWKNIANRRLPSSERVDREKMLLSDSTQEGLIISSTSTVSFVREILWAGADYVLAGRINQDPLEAYFG